MISPDKRKHTIEDSMRNLNGDNLASTFVAEIRALGIRNISGPFLGLGAGKANAERSLARKLGLHDVTLVDKHREPIAGYIEADLFEFMKTTDAKYGVVTAFSLEYLLDRRDNWLLFWECVKNVTRKDSLILISPYDEPNAIDESLFEIKKDEYGFIAQRVE